MRVLVIGSDQYHRIYRSEPNPERGGVCTFYKFHVTGLIHGLIGCERDHVQGYRRCEHEGALFEGALFARRRAAYCTVLLELYTRSKSPSVYSGCAVRARRYCTLSTPCFDKGISSRDAIRQALCHGHCAARNPTLPLAWTRHTCCTRTAGVGERESEAREESIASCANERGRVR